MLGRTYIPRTGRLGGAFHSPGQFLVGLWSRPPVSFSRSFHGSETRSSRRPGELWGLRGESRAHRKSHPPSTPHLQQPRGHRARPLPAEGCSVFFLWPPRRFPGILSTTDGERRQRQPRRIRMLWKGTCWGTEEAVYATHPPAVAPSAILPPWSFRAQFSGLMSQAWIRFSVLSWGCYAVCELAWSWR